MINIVGDTWEELANLQTIIDTGILNYDEIFNVDVNYKLLSGDSLLINKYNHIVGAKKESNDN